ncbi:AtpZ/AtpI family protein [Paracoccus aminophilus]|uniref:ATP synthase protein I n=1 Tax=Paracoccus aminophilus JCM 7686 TaxID=1367847 RepID=S5XWE1_PARAH|nr:AtpZ/AtpI family protein [Paracoccus aminophilus]AGT07725.1 ATP synthase protein I [Paracoccus aminophilus JCM 7686]
MADPERSEAEKARDAERLQELEARLRDKGVGAAPSRAEDHFSQANMAWRMVTELVAGLVLGFGIGYGLDKLLGTMPIMLVIFVLVGLVAGVKTMMRTAAEIGKKPGQSGDHEGE